MTRQPLLVYERQTKHDKPNDNESGRRTEPVPYTLAANGETLRNWDPELCSSLTSIIISGDGCRHRKAGKRVIA